MKRSTPLKARTGLTRRTPLRSRPQRRARHGEPLATWCEARIPGVCEGRAVHRHHKLMRSHLGGDEKANTADLCSFCHWFIHDNPAWAYEAGWLIRAGGAA